MTKIDEKLISKLEKLSKLKLNREEKVQISADLEDIVQMFDKLQEVDTTGIEPTRHITTHQHPLRPDKVANELSTEEALHNAPKTHGQFVACLLYTSPSPRDRQKSRMPSSA